MDPINIMMEASRFLHNVAVAFTPRDGEDMAAAIRTTPKSELEFIRKFLVDASTIAYKAAEFGYAKLSRIDYVGDAASAPMAENRYEFVLNIGDAPGRPVIDHTAKNGGGSGRVHEDD